MVADFEDYADLNGGATAESIREAADSPSTHSATMQVLVNDLGSDSTQVRANVEGDIADATTMTLNPATAAARRLTQSGLFAVGLLNSFADTVETFDTEVETLNTELNANTNLRYQTQQNTPDDDSDSDNSDHLTYSEIKQQEKDKLQDRYTTASTTLETETDRVAALFEGSPDAADAKALILAGYLPLASAGMWPGLTLSPEESYEAYQAAVRTGTIPSAADMTEAERQEWMEANPGLVEKWMELEDPSPELQAAIIGLQLPHVDGEDAENDTWRIIHGIEDGYYSPGQIQAAFDNLGQINAALAALTPWATRNNVDLATSPAVQQSQEYLKTFYEETYSKKDEIVEYINSDEHNWTFSYTVSDGTHTEHRSSDGYSDSERNDLLSGYADGILNLSNHDVGGGYADLPQELRNDARETYSSNWDYRNGVSMFVDNENFRSLAELLSHSTVEPGDGLAKQMGATAVASIDSYNAYWDNQPGGHRQPPWGSDTAADIFDMVSRNREATADLVAGTDVPANYPSDFNATIFNEPWDLENGNEGKVAKLYDWIHDDYAAGGESRTRADAAFENLIDDLTDVGAGSFEELMGPDGDSAAYRNTLLTRGLTDALADHLDAFSAQPGTTDFNEVGLSEPDRIRLMTFIASDRVEDESSTFDLNRGAARLSAYVSAYQQDNLYDWAENPDNNPRALAERNARLQGLLDIGLINEAEDRGLDVNQAEAERVRNIKIGAGMVSTLAGQIPVPGLGPAASVGNTLLGNLLTPDHMPSPNANLSVDWQVDGSHVTAQSSLALVAGLVDAGKVDPDALPPVLQDTSGHSNAEIEDAVDNLLTEYFRNNPPHDTSFYSDFSNKVNDVYDDYARFYSLHAEGDQEIDEFLTSENWGRP